MARLFARALVVVAVMMLVAGDTKAQAPQQSETQLLSQISQNPQQILPYLDLARLYAQQGRMNDAETVLQRALTNLRSQREQALGPATPGSTDNPVRVGGDIKEPTKLRDVRPVYPAEAQAARVQGVVIIEAVIDTNGNVADAKVLRSVPMLDEAAVGAVKQWRFTPTLLNGAPVPVIMTVTVNFALGG
jgi:TonB family protein